MDGKEIFGALMEHMTEKRRFAAESLEKSFDMYSSGKSCGDEEGCQECLDSHGGYCPVRELLRDAFYAGAASFQLSIEEAGRTGKPGAMTEAMERLDDEISAYTQRMVKSKLGGLIEKIVGEIL